MTSATSFTNFFVKQLKNLVEKLEKIPNISKSATKYKSENNS